MDNFHIYEEVGRGDGSIVYKGREKGSTRYVAIKSVMKDKMDKVLQEVRMLYKLQHPNVMRFHSWYETSTKLWLILEFCTGGTLKDLLTFDHRLPESAIRVFGTDLVHGLLFLHSNGIMYCDLKPSNVLHNEYGVLKLSDFALSINMDQLLAEHKKNPDNRNLRGTPFYMAPELFSPDGVHSYASDLWSLGCVLFEMAMGHLPFVAETFTELVNKIQTAPLQLPGEEETLQGVRLSVSFKNLLRSLLRKDPVKRVSWPALLTHEFWAGMPMPDLCSMPVNPVYQRYCLERVYVPSCPAEDSDSEFDEDSCSSIANSVEQNSIRMSIQAKRNLLRESMESHPSESYVRLGLQQLSSQHREVQPEGDLVLENKDQVLDFNEYDSASASEEENHRVQQDSMLLDLENLDGLESEEGRRAEPGTAPIQDSSERPSSAPSAGAGHSHTVEEAAAAVLDMVSSPTSASSEPGSDEESTLSNVEVLAIELDPYLVEQGMLRREESQARLMQQQVERLIPGESLERLPSIQQLLVDDQDHVVRPIVGNPINSKLPLIRFSAKALPFPNLDPAQAAQLASSDLENFFSRVFRALSAGPVGQVIHVLGYLYSLSTHPRLANVIVSSSLVALLIRLASKPEIVLGVDASASSSRLASPRSPMMRPATPPTPPPASPAPPPQSPSTTASEVRKLRVRCVIILAVLVRHATFIAPRLREQGLLDAFVSFSQEEHLPLRRYGAAGLGELLFYITTNAGDPAPSQADPESQWKISGSALKQLCSCLQSEDENVRHCAAKTYENVLSTAPQASKTSLRFATAEVATTLLDAAIREKSEHLRASSAMALSHLVRINRRMLPRLAQVGGWEFLANGLQAVHGSARVQQAWLNILNLVLDNSSGSGAHTSAERVTREALFGSKSTAKDAVVKALLQLLSHGQNFVVRSKAVLTLTLLLRVHPVELARLLDGRFVQILDRLVALLAPADASASTSRSAKMRAAKTQVDEMIAREGEAATLRTRRCLLKLIETIALLTSDAISTTTTNSFKMAPVIASGRVVGEASPEAHQLQRLSRETLPMLARINTSRCLQFLVSCSPELVVALSRLVRVSLNVIPSAVPDFHRAVLSLVESVVARSEAMMLPEVAVEVLQHLLPAIWQCTVSCKPLDVKVLTLRMSTDLVCLYMAGLHQQEERFYSLCSQSTARFLVDEMLPRGTHFLHAESPIPQVFANLICFAITKQQFLVRDLQRLGLVPVIAQQLGEAPNHSTADLDRRRRGSLPVLAAMKLMSCVLYAGQEYLDVQLLLSAPIDLVARTALCFDFISGVVSAEDRIHGSNASKLVNGLAWWESSHSTKKRNPAVLAWATPSSTSASSSSSSSPAPLLQTLEIGIDLLFPLIQLLLRRDGATIPSEQFRHGGAEKFLVVLAIAMDRATDLRSGVNWEAYFAARGQGNRVDAEVKETHDDLLQTVGREEATAENALLLEKTVACLFLLAAKLSEREVLVPLVFGDDDLVFLELTARVVQSCTKTMHASDGNERVCRALLSCQRHLLELYAHGVMMGLTHNMRRCGAIRHALEGSSGVAKLVNKEEADAERALEFEALARRVLQEV